MFQQDQILNFKVLQMNINSSIQAMLFDFHIQDQEMEESNNIDVDKIKCVLQEKNIQLVITTRRTEELQFIQQPILYVNGSDDHKTIIQYNTQISIEKGNILYLFDKYITMMKYIISFQLSKNNASDIHNLDIKNQQLIKENDLQSYFNEHVKHLASSSNSTGLCNSNIQTIYNLPSPIKIPVFTMNKMVKD